MTFAPFKPPRRRSSIPPSATRPRVLYVEDEDVNWEIAHYELEDRFTLSRAVSSRETFDLLAKASYHLILMDIQLSKSDLDGMDITRILKGRFKGMAPEYAKNVEPIATPIIFVTAYTARYQASDITAAGGEDMIPKPVNFTTLSLSVARIWARGGNSTGTERP